MSEESGQITIEAIFIFGMLIIVLVSISFPLSFRVKATAYDVAILTDARYVIEQIGAAADTITTPGSKRTIQVYVPGLKSQGNTTTDVPITHIATRICTDGTELTSTVLIVRRRSNGNVTRLETHNFTRKLFGSNWGITSSGTSAIVEDIGKWYDLTITWKSINSTSSNSISGIDCTTDLTTAPANF
ncbi:MAG: hypothetical protein V3V92_01345 [Candidatus Hydrothermarchaeales archaeon]